MGEHTVAIAMSVCYLAITLGASFFFTKKKGVGTKEFYVAKGNLGVVMIAALVFSEVIAGGTTVGAASTGFTTGLSSVWTNWGQAFGIVLFIVLAERFFSRMHKARGIMSIPAGYEIIFGRKSRVIMLFISALSYLLIFSTTPAAVGDIFAAILGVDRAIVIWIMGVIFVVMAAFVGLKGLAVLNLLNSIILYFSMAFVAFQSVSAAGGLGNLQAVLPASYFDVFQPDIMTASAGGIATGVACIAANSYANATFAAKDRKTNIAGQLSVAVLLIPFSFLPPLIGIAAKVIMPDAYAGSILYVMANTMSPLLGGLAAMAVLAACFSTGPSFLFLSMTTLTRDGYRVFINKDATEKQELRWFKIATVILGLLFVALGVNVPSLLNQILGAFQIRSVVGITLAIGLFWPRVSENAAFCSMLFGGATAAVWFFTGSPMGVAPFWPGAAVIIVVLVIGTLMSKRPVSEGYLCYQKLMEEARELERNGQSPV